jgi:hypothetical protein
MSGNNKAVQVRIKSVSATKAGGQRKHDLRIGKQPDYVDAKRADQNRVLIESATGSQLRKICEDRRSQRETKRAMKSSAAVGVSGIITFGHVAQDFFEQLSNDQQNAAYREVAEAVAARLNTTLHGLVHHGDEASPHAHFQLAAVTLAGTPVSQTAKRGVLKEVQTIAAEVMGRYDPRIERGTPLSERLANGEDYADTVHRSAAEMRDGLTRDLPQLRAEIAELEELSHDAESKMRKNERLADKARVKAAESDEKADKAIKRAEAYERRATDAQRAAESILERLEGLRATEDRLTASLAAQKSELAQIEDSVAQKKTNVQSLRARKAELEARLQSLNAA